MPGVLSTVMSPPIIRTRRRLIARPRPVPSYLRDDSRSPRENGWNSSRTISGAMPIPESLILNTTHSSTPSMWVLQYDDATDTYSVVTTSDVPGVAYDSVTSSMNNMPSMLHRSANGDLWVAVTRAKRDV